jgi:hypothetical protein
VLQRDGVAGHNLVERQVAAVAANVLDRSFEAERSNLRRQAGVA